MPGRKFYAGNRYRYGFNGKENDNEVKGEGNQYDYGFRIYDPRVGRFLSVDPLMSSYSMLTPYQFASNRPIDGVDLDGLEYLSSTVSKIDISINYLEFNGEKVVSGSVHLDRSKVSPATRGYLDYAPKTDGTIGSSRTLIATFQSNQYQDVLDKMTMAIEPKIPEVEDIDPPNSSKQPNLEIQKKQGKGNPLKKDLSKAGRASNRSDKQPSSAEPVIVGGGTSRLGNNLALAVTIATELSEYILKRATKNDIAEAHEQVSAVIKTVNDIQIGLNSAVFTSTDLSHLQQFANYVLDGTLPLKWTTITKDGKEEKVTQTDTKLVQRFDELRAKISKVKYGEPEDQGPFQKR